MLHKRINVPMKGSKIDRMTICKFLASLNGLLQQSNRKRYAWTTVELETPSMGKLCFSTLITACHMRLQIVTKLPSTFDVFGVFLANFTRQMCPRATKSHLIFFIGCDKHLHFFSTMPRKKCWKRHFDSHKLVSNVLFYRNQNTHWFRQH